MEKDKTYFVKMSANVSGNSLSGTYQAFEKPQELKLGTYSTNLSYVPDEVKNNKWYVDVDCSKYLALIINTFNKKEDIEPLWNGKKKIINKVKRKMKK